ncbi:DNA recombination protein RmuC [Sphingomonas gilva]|uniref:DNA recombination protein RmuC homolog n=1 Tax=Sphingomonas gilva TaxID=2305907 RepID=A0A396RLY1_9SPHN|nr:DNA recombination protein RmuC [Sphingomonas gilva]RHW17249.1 DNA recombination protein RmuC [Sphingomonas gilva]
MDGALILVAIVALIIGAGVGWLVGSRPLARLAADRDHHLARFKEAIVNVEATVRERDAARDALARLEAAREERDRSFAAQMEELKAAREQLSAQFSEIGGKLLGEAQKAFLERADARFNQAGEANSARMRALLQPVEATLKRYEEGLTRVEKERNDSYGALREAVEHVKAGLGETRSETAKLVNALRAAPKTRGRWGEQQFRNLIEIAGLSGHVDFAAEVSVATEEGQLRPDFVIRLPGDQQLIVDVKCALEGYLAAAEATSAEDRQTAMAAHARAVRTHAEALGRKAYWAQFEKAPDFVIMYIPGDNFLSGALEHDMELWERAARNRVIIAGPSAFLPLARTVAGMWRQQKLAEDAREVGKLGKEMYERLATAATHLKRVGGGLNSAVDNYNKFLASFEGRVMVSARRFQALNVDTGNAQLEQVDPVDAVARAPALEMLPSPENEQEAAE